MDTMSDPMRKTALKMMVDEAIVVDIGELTVLVYNAQARRDRGCRLMC